RLHLRRRARGLPGRPRGARAPALRPPPRHRRGWPHPPAAALERRGRLPHGDLQRRREPPRDVRQRHPRARQVRPRPRALARRAAARRDRRGCEDDPHARERPRPRGARHRRHGPAGVGRPPDSGRRGRRGRRAPARGGWAPLGRHLRLDGEPALRRVRGRRGCRPAARRPGAPLRGAGGGLAMFTGAMTALVTPFRGGEVDTRALEALVEAQIAGGIDALVPCGSTGEAATLTHEEHLAVVRAVVRVARGRVPVIAGTGSNSTAEAIRLTRGAEEAGADAALLISPYYNRPTQEGIYRHYAAVAEASRLPLIVYNIPGRTGSNITPDTLARLARIPNVVGVKEASGNLAQVLEIIHAAGPDFGVYSGDDILTLPIMAAGGRGVIAMGANLMPRAYAELTHALLAGELERARTLNHRLLPLMTAMTLEVNPIPVKTALALMGRCADEFRLPLTPMSAPARAKLEAVLREYELV